QSRSDFMRGLKENVIIGRLIPAGTGSTAYQSIQPHVPEASVMSALGIFGEEIPNKVDDSLPANPAEWLASLGAPTNGDTDPESTDE
ncbi:MAG TPA: hypothetical protein ENG98_02270, partial [Actinobacteria bacterium]|nr:hypothetical protein [Actinomycetota bacterium]